MFDHYYKLRRRYLALHITQGYKYEPLETPGWLDFLRPGVATPGPVSDGQLLYEQLNKGLLATML